METIYEQLKKIGIIPVIALQDATKAEKLAKALCNGGLPCAEITFRTQAAEKTIRIMSEKFPNMLVGAGTVLTTEQVDRAVAAGARFIVSPGLNPGVVTYCLKKKISMIPGVVTPSEIERALELGLTNVKFFPAEASGGLKMIKAVAAPYGMMNFMPTGGINAENVGEYLKFDKILACGGTWMVKAEDIANDDFAKIEKLTREAAVIVKEMGR